MSSHSCAKFLITFATVLPAGPVTGAEDSWKDTVQQIDAVFDDVWSLEEIQPAVASGDLEFLRRVSLDLVGRIPSVSEIRQFEQAVADNGPRQAREDFVEQMLQTPAFIRHLTVSLRNALIPEASEQAELRFLAPGFDAWLWEQLAAKKPYDQIVSSIITSEIQLGQDALANASQPDAFFAARRFDPARLATATSRSFLGVRLDCAQCHDHPFDQWTQEQFWQVAAFYSGFQTSENGPPGMLSSVEQRSVEIEIPGTDRQVTAKFLSSEDLVWDQIETSPRKVLAKWITGPENPWFAKMAVNRLWAQLFGRGLVHPVDDFSENNPAAVPEVLERLANDFIEHGCDFRRTLKIITATRTYQLSSRASHEGQLDAEMFARSALRGLTPEQLFDSLAEATGFYQPYRSDNPFILQQDTPRSEFLNLFRSSSRSALESQTTVLQALTMMNGSFVSDATSLQNSRTLRSLNLFPGLSTDQKIDTLYLATVTRHPTATELARTNDYLAGSSDSGSIEDVFWVLLNSSEFLLNH